jgi:hypothetical protein
MKEKEMPRHVQNPKTHIVSCRINDEEMQVLQSIAEKNKTSISDLLRMSLDLINQGLLKPA